MNIKKIVADYMRETADKIDSGDCKLTEEEQLQLLHQIAHQKLNKTEAAQLLGLSVRTFDRKISLHEIPAGKKDIGSNQLYWYRDEIVEC